MMPDNPVSPKVSSAAVATALVTLMMYVLAQVDWVAGLPEPLKAALLVLVSAGAAWVAGYLPTDPLRVPLNRRYVDN